MLSNENDYKLFRVEQYKVIFNNKAMVSILEYYNLMVRCTHKRNNKKNWRNKMKSSENKKEIFLLLTLPPSNLIVLNQKYGI